MAVEAGAVRIRLGMNAGEFHRGVNQAETAMNRLAARAATVSVAMGGAFAALGTSMFFGKAIQAFGKAEAGLAAVEAAVKSTGGTAGFTTAKLAEMATQLRAVAGVDDDEVLRNVTANLLTFGNIVGPIFREAQQAVVDLSARLGQDLQSSAIQLGKALQDPVNGLTALRRVGVAFTESQQEQIKTLMKSGDIMTAQRMILAELGKEFSGQAAAVAQSVEGRLNMAFVKFGDALEGIGKAIAPTLLPVIEGVADLSKSLVEISPQLTLFATVFTGVAVALGAVTTAVGIFAFTLGALSAPVAAVIGAIGLAVATIVTFGPAVRAMAEAAEAGFSAVYMSAFNWLVDKLGPVLVWLRDAIRDVVSPLAAIGSSMEVVKEKVLEAGPPAVEAARQVAADMATAMHEEMAQSKGFAPALSEAEAIKAVQERARAEALAQEQIAAAKKAAAEAQAELNKRINEGVQLAKAMETPRETELRQLAALDAAYKKGKISAEALGRAQTAATMTAVNAYAGLASSVAGSLAQLFNKSKGVAIASALINTFEGVTKALAAYPPPFSFVAAAGALAAGMAQVQAIRNTTKDGGGGGGASSGAAVNPNAGGGPGNAPQMLTVRGLTAGQLLTGDSVRDLAKALLDFQRDGGQVVLA